jgi:predicted phosphoribosyltransferase
MLFPLYRDRRDGGRKLATELMKYADRPDVIVLGLPRGGVPVAFEVAQALRAPLDVYVVRKLGVPGHRELAMGAIASGGVLVVHTSVVERLGVPSDRIEEVAAEERIELERRERIYRQGRGPLVVQGRTAILVDDGLATGSSMIAAVSALRAAGPSFIVVAVPIAAPEICREVGTFADEIVCPETPASLMAIGHWYEDFSQTSDDEVRALLASGNAPLHREGAAAGGS